MSKHLQLAQYEQLVWLLSHHLGAGPSMPSKHTAMDAMQPRNSLSLAYELKIWTHAVHKRIKAITVYLKLTLCLRVGECGYSCHLSCPDLVVHDGREK